MQETFEGIVLFRRQYREEDTIVKLLTKEFGKRMFFIRRGQQSNHAMRAQLIPFSKNQYVGTINPSGFSFVKEASTLAFPRKVLEDLTLQSYASYFVQLIDAVFEDFDPQPHLYHLLNETLLKVNEGFNHDILMVYFEIYLLPYFGTQLNWQHCQVCGSRQEPFDFSINLGGLICRQHFNDDPYRLHISPKAMHVAFLLANTPLNKINSINVSFETITELKRLTKELYQEFVGIRLKSKQFIDEMDQLDQKYQSILSKRGSKRTTSLQSQVDNSPDNR